MELQPLIPPSSLQMVFSPTGWLTRPGFMLGGQISSVASGCFYPLLYFRKEAQGVKILFFSFLPLSMRICCKLCPVGLIQGFHIFRVCRLDQEIPPLKSPAHISRTHDCVCQLLQDSHFRASPGLFVPSIGTPYPAPTGFSLTPGQGRVACEWFWLLLLTVSS